MKSLTKSLLLIVLYFVTGKLGLLMAVPPGYATAVWPPSGFAFAGLLIFGNRFWPSIWLGSFLVNIWTTLNLSSVPSLINSIIPALMIGFGAAMQALLGAVLVRKLLGYPLGLEREKDVFKFLVFSGPLSCLISSTVGILTLVLIGSIKAESVFFSWWTWWIGDSIGVLIFAPIMMMFYAEPRDVWRKRKITVLAPMLVTFLLMLLLFVFMKRTQDNKVREEFNSKAELMVSAIENNINRYLDILYSLQSFYKGSTAVDRFEFYNFVSNALERRPGIVALEWDPKVTQDQREVFEESVRSEGFVDFEIKEMDSQRNIQRSSIRDFYFPITFVEPLKENQNVLGFDFMSEKSRQIALEIAWKSGNLALTNPIQLLQGPKGVIAFLAVYDNGKPLNNDQDRMLYLKGFVVEVLRVEDIILEALEDFKERQFVFHIADIVPMGESVDLFKRDLSRQDLLPENLELIKKSTQGLIWKKTINLGERYWQIEVYPTADYFINKQNWNVWFILAGGLLFVGFLGGFLIILSGREVLVARLVEERTEELRKLNDQLKQEFEKQERLALSLELRNRELDRARVSALNIAQDAYEAQLKAIEAGKKLRYLSAYQKVLVDNAGYSIISGDTKGIIKSFNPAAEKMLGYKAEEVIDKVTPAIIHDPDEVVRRAKEFSQELKEEILPGFEVFVAKARRDLPNTHEWIYIRKDGSRFPVLLSVTALRDEKGEIFGFLGIASDISDLKEIQNKLIKAMNVKSEFTSMVSHELRTPLTVIRESVSLVHDEVSGPINANQKDFLDTAMRNIDRLTRLINDVLDYQKLEAYHMEFRMKKQSINELVQEVAKGFKIVLENKGVDLSLQLDHDLPNINFDRDKIIQVLTNLMNNAMKFTDKGSVILTTEKIGENTIRVSVKDQGVGIKEEDMDKLFKSFSQISTGTGRQTGGTGLGLVLTKKIIEQHNGEVGVISTYGQGSIFYFDLPIRSRRVTE